ncbi:MAG: hypothetical protein SFY80_16955 [Verrucomicrobiota bacterium]|nr:hypothetical protein [Verrucomicrobiota bacterium]
MTVWEHLAKYYSLDLFCGLFLDRNNRGLTLSPKTLKAIGERGIELGFDIYGPEEEAAK